jgi:short-subunit dehydrogenase
MVLCAGVVNPNLELDWSKDQATVAVNVNGFVALANLAANFFSSQGSGHLVGISSMSALVHSPKTTVYCASKAFVSNYPKGLRVNLENRYGKGRIFVIEVLPGWVYIEMTAKADPVQIFRPITAVRAAGKMAGEKNPLHLESQCDDAANFGTNRQ